jgi:hypothetical protein
MCKKLTYLICAVLVVGAALATVADAAGPYLAGWWKLDGDVLDSSGKGHHGTIVGNPQFVPGYYGQALQMDGVDDCVEIVGWTGILGAPAISASAWVNTTSMGTVNAGGPDSTNSIVEWGPNTSGQRFGWRINDGRLRMEHHGGSIQGNTVVADGEWHHVAVTVKANATASYPDVILWLDGRDDTIPSTDADAFNLTGTVNVRIGSRGASNDRFFTGILDDVRIYERMLMANQVKDLSNSVNPFAKPHEPTPADGAEFSGSFVVLSWTEGLYGVLFDVYFGENFADVDAGTPDTAKGRQGPKFLYIPALVAGTTYYWRVDDVQADGTTVHKGDVWSFTVPPLIAYKPNPANGMKYVDPNVTLSWTKGYGSILHDVYFGNNLADVEAGTGDTAKGRQLGETYAPGPLALDTVYYWRVDELETNMTTLHKGDVWSFKTMPPIAITDPNLVCWWTLDEGEGITAVDWSGHSHHGTFRGNPQWVEGYDGDALKLDGIDDYVLHSLGAATSWPAFSVALWVKADILGQDQYSSPFSSHVPNTGGFQIDTDGANPGSYRINDGGSTVIGPVSADWVHLAVVCQDTSATLYYNGVAIGSSTLDDSLVNQFAIGTNRNVANWFAGTIDNLRVYDKVLTQDEIKQAMRGDPLVAWDASPRLGAIVDIDQAKILSWAAGDKATQHDVYLGTNRTAVENADRSDTTGIYRGRQSTTSYTSPTAPEFGQTYYWRIDEFNTDATLSKGRVWSFTVAEYLIVDDFESYTDDVGSRIFQTWKDGWGFSEPPPGYLGNGTGSGVGNPAPPFAEQTILHSGKQAMPFEYVNDGSTGKALYSETERTFQTAQDWTKYGVKALTLYFRGYPASVGSFTYHAARDTYTISAEGTDIWGTSDEFHYAFKRLSGIGTIEVQVLDVTNTNAWAKAGVMMRESLDANSPYAAVYVTPGSGVAFQRRDAAGASGTGDTLAGFTAPYWVRLERYLGGTFRAFHSADGATWEEIGSAQMISMSNDVYVGLALTSHNAGVMCAADFSGFNITGTVTGQWQSQDIGIESNVADQLYVAVEDSTGKSAAVNHPDIEAVLSGAYQEWNIDLREFGNVGVNLASIKKMYIGVGNRTNPRAGGTGTLYFDDIRLYKPRCVASLAKPAGDFSSNCVVDYADLRMLGDNWLISTYDVTPVAPSDANLVAHYKFDGNAIDSSGNGNNGVAMGGATYTAGKIGQAISLDGLNDYVAIQNLNYASSGHRAI